MSKPEDLMRIPIPPKLTLADKNYNPAFDIPQYEYRTVASFDAERKSRLTKEFLEKHKDAELLVCNQQGIPLYALYKTAYATHDEGTQWLFKELRAKKLYEWEYDDVTEVEPTKNKEDV